MGRMATDMGLGGIKKFPIQILDFVEGNGRVVGDGRCWTREIPHRELISRFASTADIWGHVDPEITGNNSGFDVFRAIVYAHDNAGSRKSEQKERHVSGQRAALFVQLQKVKPSDLHDIEPDASVRAAATQS
jgi:hypothetical protein